MTAGGVAHNYPTEGNSAAVYGCVCVCEAMEKNSECMPVSPSLAAPSEGNVLMIYKPKSQQNCPVISRLWYAAFPSSISLVSFLLHP